MIQTQRRLAEEQPAEAADFNSICLDVLSGFPVFVLSLRLVVITLLCYPPIWFGSMTVIYIIFLAGNKMYAVKLYIYIYEYHSSLQIV